MHSGTVNQLCANNGGKITQSFYVYDFYEINFTLRPAIPIREALCGDFVLTLPKISLHVSHYLDRTTEQPAEGKVNGGVKSFRINPRAISQPQNEINLCENLYIMQAFEDKMGIQIVFNNYFNV